MGVFLNYSQTMKNIIYYKLQVIKSKQLFMLYLMRLWLIPILNLQMHIFLLVILSYHQKLSALPLALHISMSPWHHLPLWWLLRCLLIIMTHSLLALRFILVPDYAVPTLLPSCRHQLVNLYAQFIALLISISDIPVFHVIDLDHILQCLCSQDEFPLAPLPLILPQNDVLQLMIILMLHNCIFTIYIILLLYSW